MNPVEDITEKNDQNEDELQSHCSCCTSNSTQTFESLPDHYKVNNCLNLNNRISDDMKKHKKLIHNYKTDDNEVNILSIEDMAQRQR